jgi:hypothetical protein
MKKKVIWITSLILCILYIFLFNETIVGSILEIWELIANYVLICLISLIISGLISLILKKKILKIFPYTLNSIILILILGFLFLIITEKITNNKIAGGYPKYHEIKIPNNLDCSGIRYGIFENETHRFERKNDSIQIEINKKTNETKTLKIEWLNNCEYRLISNENSVKVKITSINDKNYDCFITNEKSFVDYAKKIRLRIITTK